MFCLRLGFAEAEPDTEFNNMRFIWGKLSGEIEQQNKARKRAKQEYGFIWNLPHFDPMWSSGV